MVWNILSAIIENNVLFHTREQLPGKEGNATTDECQISGQLCVIYERVIEYVDGGR